MLSEAIEYPLEGDDRLETLLVGGALYLLSVLFVLPAILIGGYSVAVARAVMAGRAEPPRFRDWGAIVRDGLYVLAISLVYWLPGFVLAGLGLGAFVVASLFGLSDGGALGALALLVAGLGAVVGFAYSLVVAYLLPAAIVNFARTDEIGAAWDREAIGVIATDGRFATAWLLAFGVLLVSNAVGGPLAVFLVGFVVFFYGQVAAVYLYTRGTMDALGISPTPPTPPSAAGDEAPGAGGESGPGDAAEPDGVAVEDDRGDGGTTGAGQGRAATDDGSGAGEDGTGEDRALTDVDGVGPATAESLVDAGYGTVADLRAATREDLAAVDGIGPAKADQIKTDVGDA